jgi:hypothetical protein
MIRNIPSCRELMEAMVSEAEQILASLEDRIRDHEPQATRTNL